MRLLRKGKLEELQEVFFALARLAQNLPARAILGQHVAGVAGLLQTVSAVEQGLTASFHPFAVPENSDKMGVFVALKAL